MNYTDALIIRTGLKDLMAKSILENVLGQLSDGIWENSPVMAHYWPYAEIEILNNEVCIVIRKPGVSNIQDTWHTNNVYNNWFLRRDKLNCDPLKIKRWFADKIHKIVSQERKYYPDHGIKFNAKCDVSLNFMYDHNENGRVNYKVSEAYTVYRSLMA